MLISSALDFTALDPALPGDDLSNIGFLPTEAAVAWYHEALPGQRPTDLPAFLNEVRAYASGPYATALLEGDRIDAATRADVVAHLHQYLGLDPAYIDRADLRIDPTRFEKELTRTRGRVTGRLDGRFFGYDLDKNADSPSFDPTLDASIQDAFVSEFNRYIRDELQFKSDDPYKPTAYGELGPWNTVRSAGRRGPGQRRSADGRARSRAGALTQSRTPRVFGERVFRSGDTVFTERRSRCTTSGSTPICAAT